MMRVRCDGGALSAAALRTLGQISTEFARDAADISDRLRTCNTTGSKWKTS